MRLLTRNAIEARLPYAEIARSCAGFRFHAGVTSRRKDTQAQEDHNVFGDRLRSPVAGHDPGSSGPLYFSGAYLGDDRSEYPLSDPARYQRPVWWRLQLTVIAAYCESSVPV